MLEKVEYMSKLYPSSAPRFYLIKNDSVEIQIERKSTGQLHISVVVMANF
jgi:hypothetical protein